MFKIRTNPCVTGEKTLYHFMWREAVPVCWLDIPFLHIPEGAPNH